MKIIHFLLTLIRKLQHIYPVVYTFLAKNFISTFDASNEVSLAIENIAMKKAQSNK